MRKAASGALLTGLATAMVFAGTGIASAAVVNSVPSADYQVCGNVYENAGWVKNAPPPGDAQGVKGAEVTATLYDSGDAFVLSGSDTTDSDGAYCVEGDETLVNTVTSGGYVVLEVTSLPAGYTVTSDNPWEPGGLFSSTHVGAVTFLAHKYSGLDSAYQFHFTVS
ncbi:hypothetical protein [Tomitella gaofuii]|uniref:hypothetical protein n=1 Tax=Tomitella gaofuii TaxID=2760083 RepID=UPI0015FAA934|nr:hypothetical protein [Tomitella gaofuii]